MPIDLESLREPYLTEIFPTNKVEVDGERYLCYLEPEVKGYDRCFIFKKEGDEYEKDNVFQVTPDTRNLSEKSIEFLNVVDIKDEEVMRMLIGRGNEIIQKSQEDSMKLTNLKGNIQINGVTLEMSYQSPYVNIAGRSLHDQYTHRVLDRQYM